MHPTPYPDLNGLLGQLVTSARESLGPNLVAIYLQGSFAVGDFDEDSDVDFLVVVDQEPTEPEVERLQEMHGQLYDLETPWAKHLEGSYFPRTILNDAQAVNKDRLWYLDNTSRVLEPSTHDNTWVVRWVTREHGIPLFGPAATELFDTVSSDLLRSEVQNVMRTWGEDLVANPEQMNNRWYQPFAVISFCRMLQTLATGRVHSKPAGVRWARENLNPRWAGLAEEAWADRADPSSKVQLPASSKDLKATVEFVREVLESLG